MNSRTGELYNVEGVITSIMIHHVIYIYINLLETQLRTSLAILGDSIVLLLFNLITTPNVNILLLC